MTNLELRNMNKTELAEIKREIDRLLNEKPTRTEAQNNSIHLWLKQVAQACNDAGYDIKLILTHFKEGVDIPCTKENLKELLWRSAQKAMYNKHSTTQLDKEKEITEIHKVVSRFLSEKLHLEYIPFPSWENQNDN